MAAQQSLIDLPEGVAAETDAVASLALATVPRLFLAHPIEYDFGFLQDDLFESMSSVQGMFGLASRQPVVVKAVPYGAGVAEGTVHSEVASGGSEFILPILAKYDNMLPYGHPLRPANTPNELGPVRVALLVTPLMSCDLLQLASFKCDSGSCFSRAEFVAMVHQLVGGLAELHRRAIVHADFKLENVFVSPTGRLLLGDFGLSQASGSVPWRTKFGTPLYWAPEIFASHDLVGAGGAHLPLNPCSDVWALGVAMMSLARVGCVPGDCVLPFECKNRSIVEKTVSADHKDPDVWAALGEQLRQRASMDLPGVDMVVLAALALDPAHREDTTVLPLHLLL
jgi:serine/threonine protein kinase